MTRLQVYEPPGMFRVITVPKPTLRQRLLMGSKAKLWFTADIYDHRFIHAGVFDETRKELKVWDSRRVRPNFKFVVTGIRYHRTNSLLDYTMRKIVYRIPFLVPTEEVE